MRTRILQLKRRWIGALTLIVALTIVAITFVMFAHLGQRAAEHQRTLAALSAEVGLPAALALGDPGDPLPGQSKPAGLAVEGGRWPAAWAAAGAALTLSGLLVAVIYGTYRRQMAAPLRALAKHTRSLTSGKMVNRPFHTKFDEIATFADQLNRLSSRIESSIDEAMKIGELSKELEVTNVFQSLLPNSRVIHRPGIVFSSYFSPTTLCGGDWWNYFDLGQDRLLLILGNTTGRGFGQAGVTAISQGITALLTDEKYFHLDLKELLAGLGYAIHQTTRGAFGMTCIATLYDPHQRSLSYVNAGHPLPYRINGQQREVSRLASRGAMIGIEASPLVSEIEQQRVQVDDIICWYTDGLIRCLNPEGEAFGEQRLEETLISAAPLGPEHLRDRIIARVREFTANAALPNDMTLIVGQIS